MAVLTASALLIGSLLLAVGVDVHLNDQNFARSFTGTKLQQYGGYEYGLLAYEQAALASNKTAQWAVDNVPLYLNATREYLSPYGRLFSDLSKIGVNVCKRIYYNATTLIEENYPIAEYWYVYYLGFCFLPGPIAGIVQGHSLITHMTSIAPHTKVQQNIPIVRDSIYSAMIATKDGAGKMVELAKTQGSSAVNYFRKNVFVGSLSPENLQKYTQDAYNTTQTFAASMFSWVNEKVKTLSKDN